MWGLSSLTRDRTSAPPLVVWILNHWDSQKNTVEFLPGIWLEAIGALYNFLFLPPSLPFFHPGQIPSSLGLLCSSQFNFIFQWSMVFFTFLFPFNTFAKIEVQKLVYNVSGTEQSDSTTHTHTHTHTHTVCVYIYVCVCVCVYVLFLESFQF